MANAVKMLPFPVTSDSAELTLLWGRGIHGRQFGYRIFFMMGRKKSQNQVTQRKSLHFMNTVCQKEPKCNFQSFYAEKHLKHQKL